MPRRKLTRGERNIAWVEQYLRVPEGQDIGQPIRLRSWQREIFIGIYDNPAITRRAIISFSRKAGKTSLCAMVLCLHLVGPEARPNSQLYSAAQSRDQAAITFNLACKMLRQSADLMQFVQIRETAKQILCPELGVVFRALSADASTAFGLSPTLILHDETSQIRGPRSELYEALETACAANRNPLSLVVSTQAPTDNDLLSILIDDAKKGIDPKVKLFLWTAGDDLDPFSDEAIRAANPAAGDFANMEELRAMAADAKRMPAREAEYRNLICNQRIEAVSPFITKAIWDLNGGEVAPFEGHAVFAGLDLAETQDLCALVLAAPIDGIWHVRPTFWLPADGLAEKARQARTPFDLWAQQGFLQTTPGKAVEYGYIAEVLYDLFSTLDIRVVAFDRFGMRHLRPWLSRAGFTDDVIEARFQDFGQGFVGMSPALRELEAVLLNGRLRHANHPILTMNAANAVVETDPAGSRKLTKKRSRGRIDGMVALAMAISVGTTAIAPKPFVSIWEDDALAEVMAA